MSPITPFKISISEEKINRLKQKLALADFPDETTELVDAWSRGSPLADVKKLASYWKNDFDWRKVEADLNKLPQYTTQIEVEGFAKYDVHFIHQPSLNKNAIPLLFVHGWPGSFIEVTKILPQLIDGRGAFPSFHVIAPSLLDFGFSSASRKKGFGVDQHAQICHKLMLSLGYNDYVTQGGDAGYLVTRYMAKKYGPTHCKAHHLNSAGPAEPTIESHPDLYAKVKSTPLKSGEIAGLGRTQWFSTEGNGYYKQASTKPQTLSYSLTDSPVGLLGWIYEKLHDWSDSYPWTNEEILTWVSIYYFSKAGPAGSGSFYYELEHSQPPAFAAVQDYVDVPLGISRFPKDLVLLPKLWNHTLGPIVFEREHDSGGHFAAWERPDAIVGDIRTMFGEGGGAYGAVPRKSGYDM